MEECNEDVDDVQVEFDCSRDVFIICVTLDQVVCVVHDVAREYDGSHEAVYHMCYLSHTEKEL